MTGRASASRRNSRSGMGPIEGLRQADLVRADIFSALALSDEAGWNQVAEDWALFIDRGRTIGLFDSDGRLIATAAVLPYDNGFGWISMVLVTAAWRHRGLARHLMQECIAVLQDQG